MPKIVDHDAYRKELARKAADIFTRHGYSSLGIRQISDELGISKSLLYHYFSGKEDLFAASTEAVLSRDLANHSIDEDAPLKKKLDQLFEIYLDMEKHFEGELTLMLDYLRGKSEDEVASDENMKRAMQAHESLVEKAVGIKHTDTVLCLMYGFLLVRYLNGRKTDPDRLRSQLTDLLL